MTLTDWCGSTAGTTRFISIIPTQPSGANALGHARSKDLVHWEHLPVALAPEGPEDKDGCFSGSAVVDGDTLALIYTGHKFHGDPGSDDNLYQVQCLATSRDGIHFERQGQIIDTPAGLHHFRDPKVWREGDTWYLIVGSRVGDTGQVRLYSSADLRQWQEEGVLAEAQEGMGYMWECPDFFTLNGKRILMFSPQGLAAEGYRNRNLFQSGYLIGDWQPGSRFRPMANSLRWTTGTIFMPHKAS